MPSKKIKISSSFFIIFCLSFTGCGQQKIANLNSSGENIICFGDSITAGSGASEGEDFPSLLRDKLGIPVINVGKGGDLSSDGLKRIREDVLDKYPLLVIVEFGGNDFLEEVPLRETLKNIDEIVKAIQERGAIVVLLDVKVNFFMNGYTNGYKRIAQKRGAVFVPNILAAVLNNPKLKSDYIHPDSQGYKIIAEKLLEVIAPIIQRNKELRAKVS